ncbi:MAG: hypothetical protein AAFQ68_12020 [Bacteroidota bacterium]
MRSHSVYSLIQLSRSAMRLRQFCFLLGLLILLPHYAWSQACCSGGVPISSNLGLASQEQGTLQLQFTYDWNHLQDLFTGNEQLDDDTRIRNTHSFLLEASYDINKRFSVSTLFSIVRQERIISTFGDPDITINTGLGDAIVLFRYNLIDPEAYTNHQLVVGIGPKIPLGRANHRDSRGIILPADLQPGTGAWDMLAWGFYQYMGILRPSTSFFGLTTYRVSGTNPTYNDVQSYRFGNEYQLQLGISDRFNLGKLMVDPSVMLRYRTVGEDRIDGNLFANTGGHWLDVIPGLQINFGPKAYYRISGNIPVFRALEGTQLTTSYKLTMALYYRFGLKKQAIEVIQP